MLVMLTIVLLVPTTISVGPAIMNNTVRTSQPAVLHTSMNNKSTTDSTHSDMISVFNVNIQSDHETSIPVVPLFTEPPAFDTNFTKNATYSNAPIIRNTNNTDSILLIQNHGNPSKSVLLNKALTTASNSAYVDSKTTLHIEPTAITKLSSEYSGLDTVVAPNHTSISQYSKMPYLSDFVTESNKQITNYRQDSSLESTVLDRSTITNPLTSTSTRLPQTEVQVSSDLPTETTTWGKAVDVYSPEDTTASFSNLSDTTYAETAHRSLNTTLNVTCDEAFKGLLMKLERINTSNT